MEDEELNEEVMGDPDNIREVEGELQHDEVYAGAAESVAEEPADEPCAEDYRLQQEIELLKEQVSGLMAAMSTLIESGVTIVEPASGMSDQEEEEEPMLYLEDLDYDM